MQVDMKELRFFISMISIMQVLKTRETAMLKRSRETYIRTLDFQVFGAKAEIHLTFDGSLENNARDITPHIETDKKELDPV